MWFSVPEVARPPHCRRGRGLGSNKKEHGRTVKALIHLASLHSVDDAATDRTPSWNINNIHITEIYQCVGHSTYHIIYLPAHPRNVSYYPILPLTPSGMCTPWAYPPSRTSMMRPPPVSFASLASEESDARGTNWHTASAIARAKSTRLTPNASASSSMRRSTSGRVTFE